MLGRFCFLHGKLIALGKHNKASEISKLIGSGLFDYFFVKKLPPYTLAGFDLTAQNFADGDDATRPCRQGIGRVRLG
jgi:hypothetical protein